VSRVTLPAAGAAAVSGLCELPPYKSRANPYSSRMTMQPQRGEVDVLTGLATGDHLDAVTCATWESATAASGALSVLWVELDDYGRYRDNYGMEAGELLVRRAGAVIRASGLSAQDCAGRLGAGEFLIILPGATLDAAHIPAERILRAIRDLEIPNRGSTVSNYVTVSIGAASCRPQPGDSMVTLIDAGASALWTAKRRGRNRIAAYELSPDVRAEESLCAIG
jgi:two-component system chemotaxis family response regulator WspR